MSADDVSISEAEARLREHVLESFFARDPRGSRRVSTSQFQGVLQEHGLRLGDEAVDRIMLECTIDTATSTVVYNDFAEAVFRHREMRLAEEAERAAEAARSHGMHTSSITGTSSMAAGSSTPSRTTVAAGREFRAALEHQLGTLPPGAEPRVPTALLEMSQPQRVRRLAREINSAFNEFDNGRVSLDLFREHLRTLGIGETPDAERLLRGPGPITFAQLFRALSADPLPASAAGTGAAGPMMHSSKATDSSIVLAPPPLPSPTSYYNARRFRPAGQVKDRDIISWRQPEGAASPAAAPAREERVWARNTALVGNVLGHGGESHARELDDYKRETGASALIHGGADTLPAEATYELSTRRSHVGAYRPPEGTTESAGVRDALFDEANVVTADSRFESVAQAEARHGLGGAVAASRPVTSAGYGSAAGSLLREQIYSLVRQLDSGAIGIGAFRSRLDRLGVRMPALAERLLGDFASHGKANFGRFVRAFDAVIAEAEAVAAVSVSAAGDAGAGPSSSIGSARGSPRSGSEFHPDTLLVPAAQRAMPAPTRVKPQVAGHGDIITWDGAREDPEDEKVRTAQLAGLRPGMQRSRALYDGASPAVDIISWEASQQAQSGLDFPVRDIFSRRRPGPEHIAKRSAGDFISWHAEAAGGAAESPAGGASSPWNDRSSVAAGISGDAAYTGSLGGRARGDLLPSGVHTGRGRAQANTELALRSRGREAPFGTEKDVPSPADRAAGGSAHRPASPTMMRSADWIEYAGSRGARLAHGFEADGEAPASAGRASAIGTPRRGGAPEPVRQIAYY